jgi:hypothetical protein
MMQEAASRANTLYTQRMPVAFFHKDCHLILGESRWKYPALSAAVLPFHFIAKSEIQKLIDTKIITLYTIDSFFQQYHYPGRAISLFTHIGGGIGDVLAFSVIPAFFPSEMISVYSEEKFFPVYRWFRNPVDLRQYFQPIVTNYNTTTRLTRYRHLYRLYLEYSAIESHDRNWYDGFFQRIGLKEAPEGFRAPLLKTGRIDSSPSMLPVKSILIAHRSSCQMRSSSLEDFYIPIRQVYPLRRLAVHETDLTDEDKRLIKDRKIKIAILPKCSIHQYLLNLYDAAMVVTTDSAAIHFREGIKKPCLGVFGAMTVESRTKYYRFTRSFDVKSDCPFQPCFIHELKKGQVCTNAQEGDRTAKCQSGVGFQEQLFENLKNYTP